MRSRSPARSARRGARRETSRLRPGIAAGSRGGGSRGPRPRTPDRCGGCRRLSIAATICSDSACFTRGSLAPWAISIGIRIWSTRESGERSHSRSDFGLGVADAALELVQQRHPVRGDRLEQGEQVGRSHDIDRAGEHVRRERRPDQRRVAAVRATVDRHLGGIGIPLGDHVLHGVHQVVVHACAPLLVARVEELLAVPGRAAEVDLNAQVSAVGEPLRGRVESPRVSRPRAAVDVQDGRRAAGVRLGEMSGIRGSRGRRGSETRTAPSSPGCAQQAAAGDETGTGSRRCPGQTGCRSPGRRRRCRR